MARRKVTRGAPPQLARSTRKGGAARGSSSGSDDPNFLSTYFREMSALDVMTAEEERAAAMKIVNYRTEYWKAILSYPPFIDGIVALIEAEVDAEDGPTAELLDMRQASRALRDRETRSNKDGYHAAAQGLAEKMSDLDVDGIVADMIAADINTVDAGQRYGTTMAVVPPRAGSRPFKAYVERIRQGARALRHAKNRFIKCNLRLVVSIARRFNHGRMPLGDLIQEGNVGLMKAVERFDHNKS